MDSHILTNIAQLLLSTALGATLGYERQKHGRVAGMRTFGIVSLAATLAMIISQSFYTGDPGRIAAQVISGMGFLGAGIIIYNDDKISGLTTAACVWATAIIGLAVGANLYWESVMSTVVVFIILHFMKKGKDAHHDE